MSRGRPAGRRRSSPARKRRSGAWGRFGSWGVLAIAAILAIGIGIGISRIDFGETIKELRLPLRHEDIIRQQADQKGVPADLIAAVIYAESRFRDQTSHAGARGLMQITPDTADVIENLSGGETFVTDDLSNPDINIRYGSFFLRHLLDRYQGNEVAVLAAYNAGITNADSWGGATMERGDIDFPETRDYVDEVLDKRKQYRREHADPLGF